MPSTAGGSRLFALGSGGAEQRIDAIAGGFGGGQGFFDGLAQLLDRGAAGGGLAGKAKQRRHEQPPEQLFVLLADQIEVAFGFVDAGEPADIGIEPEGGREGDFFVGAGLGDLSSAGCAAIEASDARGFARLCLLPERLLPSTASAQVRSACFFGFADAGAGEEHHLDAGGDAPGLFAFKSERGEGLGERLAEAQAVKEIEGYAFGLLEYRWTRPEVQARTRRGWGPTWPWP